MKAEPLSPAAHAALAAIIHALPLDRIRPFRSLGAGDVQAVTAEFLRQMVLPAVPPAERAIQR